ncbi:MAG: hypothetical protein M3Y51_05440 [Actinomycetota bacterium]|nr:hypothetical protein [Actinomycetota bacterium]
MLAKVVHGTIDPDRVDDAARAVRDELVPSFSAQRGALRGYWTADRLSGQVLIVTIWTDGDALDAARSVDGADRARVADRIGLRIHSVQSMVVLGHGGTSDEPDELDVGPVWRWARATWISGTPEHAASVPGSHRATLPDQARDAGFRGSFWLADESISSGVALSFWDGPTHWSAASTPVAAGGGGCNGSSASPSTASTATRASVSPRPCGRGARSPTAR